jgi:ribosomal protein L11 methyltransferase
MTGARPADRVATVAARLTTDEQTARRIADAVAEALPVDNAAVSLAEGGDGDTGDRRWQVAIYFPAPAGADAATAVRALVADAAGAETADALRFETVAAADWVRQSLAGLAPVAVGRFVVHGAHDRKLVPVNRIGIEIEAALAFGSGHHGSTRGCLVALERICKAAPAAPARRARILDIGTGSGVLAIAAARALHRCVLATDIDAAAVAVARANTRRNRVGGMVAVARVDGAGDGRLRGRAPFDLVFANVLLRPLVRIAAPLRRLIAPGARVVLSGILPAQANAVIAAYRPLALEHRIASDGWTTLVFRRRFQRLRICR